MPKAPISEDVQEKAVGKVKQTFDLYNTLLSNYRNKWLEQYTATYIFEVQDRNAQGQSQIFFPKCYEQVEKVAPRIYGNNPKFVVGLNVPINNKYPEADMIQNMDAVQKSLNYFWRIGNCSKKARMSVKTALWANISWALVDFETKTVKNERREIVTAETGEQIERIVTVEEAINAYPTFEVPDIFDVYFDPRIEDEDDMRAIIRNKDDVAIADLKEQKDVYFNLDKLDSVGGEAYSTDGGNYKQSKFNLQGIPQQTTSNACNVKVFYGYFSETDDPNDEKLVKITLANDSIVIGYKELTFNPWSKWSPSDVPNQAVGKGLVEPIIKLQSAYNLTRNQRAENVSLVLNRMWALKQGSNIDPRKLVSRAGNIIPMKDLDSLAPIPTPDVTQSSFEEANAINTEIQQTLGTIDASQDSSDSGFTNLATGQKIRWQEYNVRYKAIRQNFEEFLAKVGMKMLLMVGEEANKNPLVQDEITKKFYEIAKTAFDQVSDFYNVTVVADSTANDSIENKRDEVLAFGQLCLAYKSQGVPINMTKVWRDIADSFPGRNPDEYLEEQPQAQEQLTKALPQSTVDSIMPHKSPDELLNQSLADV